MVEISVIVPVYNAEKYIDRCIDSILSQTFKDFEVILVNDGSIDKSGEICDIRAKADSRVRVIHQKNQGQAAARNNGVAQATGRWIHFVDADDLIHPQMLEILYYAALENKSQISMCQILEAEDISQDFFIQLDSKYTVKQIKESIIQDLYDHGKYSYWIVCGKLIDKEIVEKVPFEVGRIYEDNAVVCKWLYYADKIVICDNVMYFYYKNSESTTKSNYSLKQLDWLWALEKQMQFYKEKNYRKMYKIICSRYIMESANAYSRVSGELKNIFVAKKIKWKILAFYFKHYNDFSLSREQSIEICSKLWPATIHFLWKLKNKGIKNLFDVAGNMLCKWRK